MEYWDLYTRERRKTGKLHRRGEPLPEGMMHLVVSIWTVNEQGQLLLTLRAPEKELYPGYWEITAGSVLAGETGRQGAVRELYEETGIRVSEEDLHFLETQKGRDAFVDLYLATVPDPLPEIRLQPGETVDATWVSLDVLDTMIADNLVAAPVARRLMQGRPLLEELIGPKAR